MNYVKLIAPAKVNLVLAVGPKGDDGYHQVNTVMHALSLHDTLEMRRIDLDGDGTGLTICLKCECSSDIGELNLEPSENIVYKAVENLYAALGRTADEQIDISLSKVIPFEAGLGGGSSNAAAALFGAATLWDIDPKSDVVMSVAAELGADVSFFLWGACSYLTGKGEVFHHELEPSREFVLLVRPEQGVSTAEAYKLFDEDPQYADPEFIAQLENAQNALEVPIFNNLQKPAEALVPEIAEISAWADEQEGVRAHFLCGSGSAYCLICESYDKAAELSVLAHKKEWWYRSTTLSKVGVAAIKAF
ncbi:MAG: 4-(cytidine 5'-diphospho)-2-C-methyl-D-erythritol kinase [Anaerotardibacter sp.]